MTNFSMPPPKKIEIVNRNMKSNEQLFGSDLKVTNIVLRDWFSLLG